MTKADPGFTIILTPTLSRGPARGSQAHHLNASYSFPSRAVAIFIFMISSVPS